MSTYVRKTYDVYELHVNYGQGWEHEVSEDTRAEAVERRKEYRENCPEYPVRIVKRRHYHDACLPSLRLTGRGVQRWMSRRSRRSMSSASLQRVLDSRTGHLA